MKDNKLVENAKLLHVLETETQLLQKDKALKETEMQLVEKGKALQEKDKVLPLGIKSAKAKTFI
jgi:hypothetical protein